MSSQSVGLAIKDMYGDLVALASAINLAQPDLRKTYSGAKRPLEAIICPVELGLQQYSLTTSVWLVAGAEIEGAQNLLVNLQSK
jgi:hypothetical protein